MTLKVRQMPCDSSCRNTKSARQMLILLHLRSIAIPVVACKYLVRALAGQYDGNMLPRELRKEVQRHRRRVGLRLIHMILYRRQAVHALLRRQRTADIADAEQLRQLARIAGLVKLFVFVAHRKGKLRAHSRSYVARVDTAGEKCADLDIGYSVC